MNLTLSHRALLLVAVPLAFELCFVVVLISMQRQLETEYAKETSARRASMFANEELTTMIEAISNESMYNFNHDERYLRQCNAAVEQLKRQKLKLAKLVETDMSADLLAFANVSDEMITTFDEVRKVRQSGDPADLLRGALRVQRLLKDLSMRGSRFIEHQEILTNQQQQVQQRLRQQTQQITIAGVILSVVLALGLTLNFNYGIRRRLKVLMENTFHLARHTPLEPPLHGSDEIARIDATFHTLAVALEDARQKEQALMDNAVDVICSLDEKGRFVKVNKAASSAWGYEPDELIGTPIFVLLTAKTVEQSRRALEELIAGKSQASVELIISRKDSSVCETLWTMRWSEKEKSIFCVAHDVSERKMLERLKADFVAMISHDLRSPLTGLKGIFEMFKAGYLGELNTTGSKRVDSADRILNNLVSMINDLLDMEKLESGMFDLDCHTCSVTEMIDQALESVRGIAEPRKISLLSENADLNVFCDRTLIERVLVNLADNAIKFSPEGAEVSINADELTDAIRFTVADKGRGIPQDKLDIVFDRFRQADATDAREKKGSGLGLAICKAIIEAHRGKIGVESTFGIGSKFWFSLPKPAKHD